MTDQRFDPTAIGISVELLRVAILLLVGLLSRLRLLRTLPSMLHTALTRALLPVSSGDARLTTFAAARASHLSAISLPVPASPASRLVMAHDDWTPSTEPVPWAVVPLRSVRQALIGRLDLPAGASRIEHDSVHDRSTLPELGSDSLPRPLPSTVPSSCRSGPDSYLEFHDISYRSTISIHSTYSPLRPGSALPPLDFGPRLASRSQRITSAPTRLGNRHRPAPRLLRVIPPAPARLLCRVPAARRLVLALAPPSLLPHARRALPLADTAATVPPFPPPRPLTRTPSTRSRHGGRGRP